MFIRAVLISQAKSFLLLSICLSPQVVKSFHVSSDTNQISLLHADAYLQFRVAAPLLTSFAQYVINVINVSYNIIGVECNLLFEGLVQFPTLIHNLEGEIQTESNKKSKRNDEERISRLH